MKTTVLLLIALVCGRAWGVEVGAYASYWHPDVGDTCGGVGMMAVVDVNPRLAVEGRMAYYPELDPPENDLVVVPIEVGLRLKGRWRALEGYAGAGGGRYIIHAEHGQADDAYGHYVVIGLKRDLGSRFAVFVDLQYRWLKTDVENVHHPGAAESLNNFDMHGGIGSAGFLFRFN